MSRTGRAPNVTVKRDSGGRPGALVASLSDPGGNFPGTAPVAFSAPGSTVLAANTSYWVVINENQSNKLPPGRTTSDGEDSASLSDWSIADGSLRQDPNGNGTWSNTSDSLLIDVKGYANGTTPELSITGGSVLEGGNVTFTVSLEFALPGAATVQYSTSIATSDTASADDFTAASAQTLTIPAGDTRATFTVATTDDSTAEDDETFTVTLSQPLVQRQPRDRDIRHRHHPRQRRQAAGEHRRRLGRRGHQPRVHGQPEPCHRIRPHGAVQHLDRSRGHGLVRRFYRRQRRHPDHRRRRHLGDHQHRDRPG